MKNFIFKFLLPFLSFLFIASPIVSKLSEVCQPAFAISPVVLMLALIASVIYMTAYFRVPHTTGVYRQAVQTEVWANYIIERLFKDNKFLTHAFSDDDKVLMGKIVHIPQPGAAPNVVKNRTSYPGVAIQRADTDILYALDNYTTDPTHIPEADKIELSYDKINSVYGDHAGYISQAVADNAIYNWLTNFAVGTATQTAPTIIGTTGGTAATAAAATVSGATGNRLILAHEDLKKAKLVLNKQNIPAENRYALIDSDMLDQLTTSMNSTQFNAFSQYFNAETGVVGQLYGFNILERSSVAYAETASGATTINAVGAAADAGTNAVAICWHENAVSRALGEVKFFENIDRAEWYGDVYSAYLRFGGRLRRADGAGLVAIVQTAA